MRDHVQRAGFRTWLKVSPPAEKLTLLADEFARARDLVVLADAGRLPEVLNARDADALHCVGLLPEAWGYVNAEDGLSWRKR